MDKSMKKNYKIIGLVLIAIITLSIIFIIFTYRSNDSNSNNNEKIIDAKIVDSIEVLQAPDKRFYKEGEFFDKTGMIVKAKYNDGTESFIDNYTIDKVNPLTIYDSEVTISYQGKAEILIIYIGNEEGIELYPNPSKEKYTIEPVEGITRFEIEDSDISNWLNDEDIKTKIVERNDASNGKFLTGIEKKNIGESNLNIILDLKYNAEITMYASFSQSENCKIYDIDILSIFSFLIDENKSVDIDGESILNSRKDITKWQLIKYKLYTLPKGKHTISLKLLSTAIKCIPNIDYINFKTKEKGQTPIDPDAEIPPYDFHSLPQYQYIMSDSEDQIIFIILQKEYLTCLG